MGNTAAFVAAMRGLFHGGICKRVLHLNKKNKNPPMQNSFVLCLLLSHKLPHNYFNHCIITRQRKCFALNYLVRFEDN